MAEFISNNTLGIYKIVNGINEKFYVGSAVNFRQRWVKHRNLLRANKHPNKYFQNSWNKHGEENFIFDIIEEVSKKEKLLEREQYYLDTLLFAQEYINKENKKFLEIGYNLCPTAGNMLGYKHTEEAKRKSRRIKSEQEKRKISNSLKGENNPNFGKSPSTKTLRKRSESMKGKTSRKVVQFDLSGNFIKEWDSIKSAALELKLGNHITQVCRGQRKSCGGFLWFYKNNKKA